MPLIAKPASSAVFSAGSIAPPLQTAAVVTAAPTSITSLASMSSKLRLPLADRSCAAASAASVKPKSAMPVVMTGTSFVPVIVTLTVSVALAPPLSVTVTV